MATSGDIYTQLQTQYDPNNAAKIIEEGIRNANRGTIENLMRDATDQMGNAYGAFNNSFAEAGNSTARTMSPAQRLALAQSRANQGMAGLNLNRGLRDFYRTSINDTIGKAMNAWDMGRNDLKDRYGMLLGKEQYADQLRQQEWERQMAEKQLAASSSAKPDWNSFLKQFNAYLDGSADGTTSGGKLLGENIVQLPNGKIYNTPGYNMVAGAGSTKTTNKTGSKTIPTNVIPTRK